jgi:lipopolysaccharide transport system ATP-binding protein
MTARVAVVGTFDVDNYGDHLFPRIAALELGRRIPGVVVDAWSPFGLLHPTRFGGGALPLGPWRDDRLDRFAAAYDAFVVGGGELLHLNDPLLASFYGVEPGEVAMVQPSRWFLEGLGGGTRERSCPVLWNAIGVPFDLRAEQADRVRSALAGRSPAVVRDPFSAARLTAAGVLPPVDVVPDTGLLVDRLFDPSEVDEARARLATSGSVVVQGCDLIVPFVEGIAAAVLRTGLSPVLVETGRCRGDGDFADAMAVALAARGVTARRVPPSATLVELVAVLSSAALVVGSSLHAAITALVHDVPFVVLDLGDESKLRGFGAVAGCTDRVVSSVEQIDAALGLPPVERSVVDDLQRRVDVHFDAMATAIVESASERAAEERPPRSAADLVRDSLLSHVAVLRHELAALRGSETVPAPAPSRLHRGTTLVGRVVGRVARRRRS